MEKAMMVVPLVAVVCVMGAVCSAAQEETASQETDVLNPWCGKYCMSFFTRARSAKTVGKGHLSASVKVQHFDWDLVRCADGDYHGRASGQDKERLATVLCFKYGWAENHHIAVGIPYWFNDFDIPGKENDRDGFANVFVFEKWQVIKETNTMPAVAFDIWYYFPTGDSDEKLGTDDGAVKLTSEISKAWKDFSLHANPGYTWGQDEAPDIGEFNAAVLTKPHKTFWPGLEYNYLDIEDKGHRHDLVPGFIWKFASGWSFKLGTVVNLDSTFKDRDRLGVVMKLFYRW